MLIKNGRVIDPANDLDKVCDVLIVDEKVADIGRLNGAVAKSVEPVDVAAPPNRKLQFEDSRNFIEKLRSPLRDGQRPLTIELFMKAFDIPTALMTNLQLAASRPQVLIRPHLDPNLKVEDFNRLDEAIEVGYEAAVEALDREWPS